MSNVDHDALKGFVDRLFNVEQEFADQKAEYNDSKKDLKAEIKGKVEETGVTVDQVVALAKIRMNEAEALDLQAEANANAALYDEVYGFNAVAGAADGEVEEEDPLG
jgi:hypothetical protein